VSHRVWTSAFSAHLWGPIPPLSRYGVPVLMLLEFHAVALNIIKEEGVKKPNVIGIVSIKGVKSFKAGKEGPPATSEVAAGFTPHPLNPSIVCGTVGTGLPFNIQEC